MGGGDDYGGDDYGGGGEGGGGGPNPADPIKGFVELDDFTFDKVVTGRGLHSSTSQLNLSRV
jgi:hypothetical protein